MNTEQDGAVKPLKPHQKSEQNDVKGLYAIHRFRWLRSREIGNVLWPTQKNRHTSAARLIRKWLENDWVIERKLPESFGPVYVLSQRGANFLAQHGLEAKTGKRVGVFLRDKSWVPNRITYKHDLLSNGFLTFWLGSGYKIKTEVEIAEANPFHKKIPDGLFCIGEDWFALEVERERKTGENARKLAQNIIDIENGEVIFDFDDEKIFVDQSAVLYENPETGGIDHFSKIKKMIESRLKDGDSIDLVKIICEVSGGGFISASFFREKVRSDWNMALLKSVDGWEFEKCRNSESSLKCLYMRRNDGCPIDLYISKSNDQIWNVEISQWNSDDQCQKLIKEKKLNTENEDVAIKKAKEILIDLQSYREWHYTRYKTMSIDDL